MYFSLWFCFADVTPNNKLVSFGTLVHAVPCTWSLVTYMSFLATSFFSTAILRGVRRRWLLLPSHFPTHALGGDRCSYDVSWLLGRIKHSGVDGWNLEAPRSVSGTGMTIASGYGQQVQPQLSHSRPSPARYSNARSRFCHFHQNKPGLFKFVCLYMVKLYCKLSSATPHSYASKMLHKTAAF